jgi:hypothetical protein
MATEIAKPTKPVATLPALADQINHHHRQCEAAMQSGLQHALEAGRLLVEAKGQVKHGDWGAWLEEHFEGAERTAQAYIRVARQYPRLKAKAQRVADLTFRGALAAVASNSQKLAAASPKQQTAALKAWDKHGCKNAHQAVDRARREKVEAECRSSKPKTRTTDAPPKRATEARPPQEWRTELTRDEVDDLHDIAYQLGRFLDDRLPRCVEYLNELEFPENHPAGVALQSIRDAMTDLCRWLASLPPVCPNCGHDEVDDDGDCAKCRGFVAFRYT